MFLTALLAGCLAAPPDSTKGLAQLQKVFAHFQARPTYLQARVLQQSIAGTDTSSRESDFLFLLQDNGYYQKVGDEERLYNGQHLLVMNHATQTMVLMAKGSPAFQQDSARNARPAFFEPAALAGLRQHYRFGQVQDRGTERQMTLESKQKVMGTDQSMYSTGFVFHPATHRPMEQWMQQTSLLPLGNQAIPAGLPTVQDKEGRRYLLRHLRINIYLQQMDHEAHPLPFRMEDRLRPDAAEGFVPTTAFAHYQLTIL